MSTPSNMLVAPKKLSQTHVKASGGDFQVTGTSGNADFVNKTLGQRASHQNILTFYEQIFKHLKKSPKVAWNPEDCAEAHAAAQLLSKGVEWSAITFEIPGDSFGAKSECGNCAQWIYNGSIVQPDSAPKKESGAAKVTLADYIPITIPVAKPKNAWAAGPPKPVTGPPKLDFGSNTQFPALGKK